MSHVEELPDELGDGLQTKHGDGKAAPSTAFPILPAKIQKDGLTPALPPQIQGFRSHSADEIVQMLGRTPLFMTSMDNVGEDEENVELEALRALQYEGTPAENGLSFKEQGNEMSKVKKWGDAKEFYTKAIAVLSKKVGKTELSVEDVGNVSDAITKGGQYREQEKEKEIEEACFVNRALCNLELKNFRSTTLDCASALRLNGRNIKAYYRSSQALLALDKIAEAHDSCRHGLLVDPNNSALMNLMIRISAKEATIKASQDQKRQKAEIYQKRKTALATAIQTRNIRIRKTAQPPDLEDACVHLAPDPLSVKSSLYFPVLLLYPLHAQTDFIKAFPETDVVLQHLEYIFPLPWDEQREYQIDKVEIYIETTEGGLFKAGKKMSLIKVLGRSDVEIVDELVKINIVPQGRARVWIEELKLRKGK